MIDGIAATFEKPPSYLLQLPKLYPAFRWKPVSKADRVVLRGKLGCLHLKATVRHANPELATITVRGSLVRFRNHGYHNGSHLRFNGLQIPVEALSTLLLTDARDMTVNSIEICHLLHTAQTAREALSGLVAHKGEPFTLSYKKRGDMYRIVRPRSLTVKLYDKGRQLRERSGAPDATNGHLLKVEIKARASYLRRRGVGIRTLADLTDRGKVTQLLELLLRVTGELVWFDDRKAPGLPSPEQLRASWADLNGTDNRSARQCRKRRIAKYYPKGNPSKYKQAVYNSLKLAITDVTTEAPFSTIGCIRHTNAVLTLLRPYQLGRIPIAPEYVKQRRYLASAIKFNDGTQAKYPPYNPCQFYTLPACY